eukprot:356713-Chlamydomonas_euryale.AAC.2
MIGGGAHGSCALVHGGSGYKAMVGVGVESSRGQEVDAFRRTHTHGTQRALHSVSHVAVRRAVRGPRLARWLSTQPRLSANVWAGQTAEHPAPSVHECVGWPDGCEKRHISSLGPFSLHFNATLPPPAPHVSAAAAHTLSVCQPGSRQSVRPGTPRGPKTIPPRKERCTRYASKRDAPSMNLPPPPFPPRLKSFALPTQPRQQ